MTIPLLEFIADWLVSKGEGEHPILVLSGLMRVPGSSELQFGVSVVDLAEGRLLWTRRFWSKERLFWRLKHVDRRHLIVSGFYDSFWTIDTQTGEPRWVHASLEPNPWFDLLSEAAVVPDDLDILRAPLVDATWSALGTRRSSRTPVYGQRRDPVCADYIIEFRKFRRFGPESLLRFVDMESGRIIAFTRLEALEGITGGNLKPGVERFGWKRAAWISTGQALFYSPGYNIVYRIVPNRLSEEDASHGRVEDLWQLDQRR